MSAANTPCPSFGELADYWTVDVASGDSDRIETHVFECERCARLLAEAERIRHGIGAAARAGAVQAFVDDAVLNRLARDGVRIRTYVLGPGESVRCTVWADDDVVVARLRGDFSGVTSVDADLRLDSGEEWGRASDVPVGAGTTELLLALPASAIREAPRMPMRLTLRPSSGSGTATVLAEYVFHHEGVRDRSGGSTEEDPSSDTP